MKRLHRIIATACFALPLTLAGSLAAQDNQGGQDQIQNRQQGGQNFRGLGGIDWQNMDPQQIQEMFRQRMLENYRTQLEVENDDEWKVIEERLSKVLQARQELGTEGAGLMGIAGAFGRGGRGGGGFGGGGGQGGPGAGGGGRGLQALFGQSSAESQALQQAIDAKAPTAELKEKLAKLQEVRKAKQANLTKTQDELRKVLSVRRESIAVLMGILD